MPRTLPFLQYDVFTRAPFGGNPLAVFPEAEGVAEADMLRLAREMNLSETTFVLPPEAEGADARVRIFSPRKELPFAGHPIVGTAWALAERALLLPDAGGRLHVEVGMEARRVLPVAVERSGGRVASVTMTQGAASIDEAPDGRALEAVVSALGARDALEPALPPALVSTGLPWLMVGLASAKAVAETRPDFARLEDALARLGAAGAYVFALVRRPHADVHARGFCPGLSIPEDPATGSAAGCLGGYLARRGLFAPEGGVRTIRIEQGVEMERPSRLTALVEDAGGGAVVRLRGECVFMLEGEARLP